MYNNGFLSAQDLARSAIDPGLQMLGYGAGGLAVGAGVTLAFVCAAPLAVPTLILLGLSAADAEVAVTAGTLAYGALGVHLMATNTYVNVRAGNWNAVAYDSGATRRVGCRVRCRLVGGNWRGPGPEAICLPLLQPMRTRV